MPYLVFISTRLFGVAKKKKTNTTYINKNNESLSKYKPMYEYD
jgi:hypothetical protein